MVNHHAVHLATKVSQPAQEIDSAMSGLIAKVLPKQLQFGFVLFLEGCQGQEHAADAATQLRMAVAIRSCEAASARCL